jgi:glycosyltransferase involved in cell wall biosynthesis
VPDPLRICHLGKFYPPSQGGIETHVRNLARMQIRQGHRPRVICMHHEPGPTVEDRDGDISITRVGRRGTFAKLDYCPGLVDLIRSADCDLFHMQVPNPTMILAFLLARAKPPLVVTYQSDHIRQRVRGMFFRPVEHRLFRKTAAILATSPTYIAGSSLLTAYHARVRVVPMGIDLAPYLHPNAAAQARAQAIRAEYPGPIWLALGRLVYYKGMHVAIEALKSVPGTLLIIGEGPDRQQLEAQATAAGVAGRVKFLGMFPNEEVAPYYLASTAFWFPSNARSEAFGLVQVEAMASGCPVLNTAIPHSGVAWVSRHDESGLTVPINDAGALAAAARRLVEEPGLRERLAAAGKARAQADFDQEVMAARVLEVYDAVLKERRSN